jgi:hypothetical protein
MKTSGNFDGYGEDRAVLYFASAGVIQSYGIGVWASMNLEAAGFVIYGFRREQVLEDAISFEDMFSDIFGYPKFSNFEIMASLGRTDPRNPVLELHNGIRIFDVDGPRHFCQKHVHDFFYCTNLCVMRPGNYFMVNCDDYYDLFLIVAKLQNKGLHVPPDIEPIDEDPNIWDGNDSDDEYAEFSVDISVEIAQSQYDEELYEGMEDM